MFQSDVRADLNLFQTNPLNRRKISQYFNELLVALSNYEISSDEASLSLARVKENWSEKINGTLGQWLGTAAMCFSNFRNMKTKLEGLYKIPSIYQLEAFQVATLAMTNHIRRAKEHEPEGVLSRPMYLDGLFLSGDPEIGLIGIIPKFIESIVKAQSDGDSMSLQYALRILHSSVLPGNHFTDPGMSPHYQQVAKFIPNHREILLSEILLSVGRESAARIWTQIKVDNWEEIGLLGFGKTPVIHAYGPGNYFDKESYESCNKVPHGGLSPHYLNSFSLNISNPQTRIVLEENKLEVLKRLDADIELFQK